MRIKIKEKDLTISDHLARSWKVASWLIYGLFALVLILFGAIHIIAGFLPDSPVANYILPEIFRTALEEAQDADPGEKGDYFNFLIGVPLAAAGSAVAAVVAASAKSVANRQRLVQEMGLVDSKLTTGGPHFLQLVNAIDDLHERGHQFRRLVREIIDAAHAESVHPLSVVADDVASDDRQITAGESVDRLRDKYLPLIEENLDAIGCCCEVVFDKFQVLTFDPFWARAIEIQGKHCAPNWYRIEERMRAVQGTPAKDPDDWSPRAVSRQLRRWTLENDAERALLTFLYLPADATPLEFVGAIIRLETEEGEFPRAEALKRWSKGDESTLTIVNRGASGLFTLFYALPSQEALQATVFSLFPNLNTYESRGYFRTLANKRKISSDGMLDFIDDAFLATGSLIYLQGMTPETIYSLPERLEQKATSRTGSSRKRKREPFKGVLPMRLQGNDAVEIKRSLTAPPASARPARPSTIRRR
ncbi:hypothetical protein HK107_11180 [Parvularcula sp. ZS-1/3]|uniref:Uncharacterized protein n=1 Tax=Parvularcula mediterranea TaxID=2732508 RepID=A0A7Y3W5L4_9PROT|nr:hypothetical protein [Parvularcula mediterranea]NNU16880.1 hypothetical protein [Parvularcula mediterranea]